jgi:hypothetical protein
LKPLHQLPSDFIVVELGLKKEDKQKTNTNKKQDLLGQVSRLRKREGQKYVNFYGRS